MQSIPPTTADKQTQAQKKAFGVTNNKACPTGASWWNADCENAKYRFRDAHRKDTEGMQGIGALRLSAETVALRSFFLTLGVSGRSSRMPLRNAPLVTSRNGRIILRVWLAHQVQTLMR